MFCYVLRVQKRPRRKLCGRSKQRWGNKTLNNIHHKHAILGNLFKDLLTFVNATLNARFIIHLNFLVGSVSEKE